MSNDDKSHYTLPNNQPVVLLQCEPAFNALSQNEKLYAHYLSRASWYGSFITTIQISPESPLILALLHNIFLLDPNIPKLKETALAANVTEDEFTVSIRVPAPKKQHAHETHNSLSHNCLFCNLNVNPTCQLHNLQILFRHFWSMQPAFTTTWATTRTWATQKSSPTCRLRSWKPL